MTSNTLKTSYDLAAYAANMAEDKKAKNTVVLDTEQVSSLADYFVITSVESRTQMRALAEQLVKTATRMGMEPIGQNIDSAGRWSLIDFGDVIVHLFHTEDREYYMLERFWSHATEIPQHTWLEDRRQVS